MKILNNIEIIDLALKYKDCLILGDLHLGFEQSLVDKGILIPYSQIDQVIEKVNKIIKKAKPKTIIINGDLKDEFGKISQQEWKDSLKFIDSLKEKYKLIFIKGNHDTILEPIAKKRDIEIKTHLNIDDISIVHGDILIKNLKKTIIISHEHPAISFKERPDEKFKCFLKGKYKSHNLIVMPSFNPLIEGSDVTKEEFLSPYLKNIKNFEIYVVEDKVYKFGKLKNLN
ncbi:MAG: metallophosphoesterase [Nanoarchaeota archaeon]